MEFYVIEIATGDAKIAGTGMYGPYDENMAIATWHGKLSTARKSPLFTSDLVVVMNADGVVTKVEKYEVPAVEENPDEETVEEVPAE